MAQIPPPPKRKSRSFKQMKDDMAELKAENERLRSEAQQKTQPTYQEIQARNPNRQNPNPTLPTIKLMDYATDWIEQDRSNVVVELNNDFEDQVIEPHARIVEADNLSLVGLDIQAQQRVKALYDAFTVLNLCYRLLITLPASYRLEAKTLIDAIKADDPPQNTAVVNEMLSHIGKTSTDSYGNLRLAYPLQMAKKKILKAIVRLRQFPTIQQKLQFKDDSTVNDIALNYKTGVFKDRDGPDFIASMGLTFLDEKVDYHFKYKVADESYYWSIPDRQYKTFFVNGRYRPTVDFVSRWCRSCRVLLGGDEDTKKIYYQITCAMIAQIIDLRFMTQNKSLNEWNSDFRDSKLQNLTWEDFSTYFGIADLDAYFTDQMLANNYFTIVNEYRILSEKHVKMVFKLNNVKKDEYGTEAQMLHVSNWQATGNNAVDTHYKINDKNKAVAAGVFNFSYRVETNVNDRMYLKNPVSSILSNLISKFSRK